MGNDDRADRDIHPLPRLIWQLVENDRAMRSDSRLNMNMLIGLIHGFGTSSGNDRELKYTVAQGRQPCADRGF